MNLQPKQVAVLVWSALVTFVLVEMLPLLEIFSSRSQRVQVAIMLVLTWLAAVGIPMWRTFYSSSPRLLDLPWVELRGLLSETGQALARHCTELSRNRDGIALVLDVSHKSSEMFQGVLAHDLRELFGDNFKLRLLMEKKPGTAKEGFIDLTRDMSFGKFSTNGTTAQKQGE